MTAPWLKFRSVEPAAEAVAPVAAGAGPWKKFQAPAVIDQAAPAADDLDIPTFRNSATLENGLQHSAVSPGMDTFLKGVDKWTEAPGSLGVAAKIMQTWGDAFRDEKAGHGGGGLASGMGDTLLGAQQNTNARSMEGRIRLGDLSSEDDGGNRYYLDGQGQEHIFDPKQAVLLRDPQSGQLAVYSRSEETSKNGLAGVSNVIADGLVVGPLLRGGASLAGRTAGALTSQRAAKATEDLAAFDRSGVPVYAPAFSDGPGRGLAKSLADTPFVGKPLANAADASAKATAGRVDDIAGRFGTKPNEQQAGVTVREGIERFKDARPTDVVEDGIKTLDDKRLSQIILAPSAETSFKTKQGALYERAWRLIPEEMQKGKSVKDESRFMSAPSEARSVIEDIVARNTRMINSKGGKVEAPPMAGGQLGRMIEAIRSKNWTANLQTLRDMRSEVRRLASGMADTEKNVLKTSDLDRIQAAITRDMIGQLKRNADEYLAAGKLDEAGKIERAIKEFSRADQYTRLSIERMEKIERLFNADTGEALARNITNAALGGGRGNIVMLQTLAKTLRPDEMGEVRSMIFSKLGRPVGSARGSAEEMAFSPNTFTTSWNKMSPEAKALLFDGEHRKAIDDIVTVANRLSNVDAMGNVSRSGTHAINVGGVFALLGSVATGSVAPVAGAAAGSWGLAYLLSRPAYAKWTAQYLKLKSQTASAPKAIDAALAIQVNRLAQMAQHDPQLAPILKSITSASENGVGEGAKEQRRENQRDGGQKDPGNGQQGNLGGSAHPPINSDGSVLKEGPKPTFRDKAADFLGSIHGGDATHKNTNYTAIDALSMFPPIGAVVGIDEARHMSEDGSPVAAAGLGILSLLPGGGGAKKGAEKALGAVAREIEELAPRYRQLFGKDFMAPKARPGTPADEVLKGEMQTLDELRSAVTSKEAALAKMPDVPSTPKIRDVTGERDEMLRAIEENPTTKAIPGRQGIPSIKEQKGLIQDFYKDGNKLPDRPWGAGPLDYQRVVRDQHEAKQALAVSKQQIADGNKALRAAEKSNDKKEIARLKAELKAVNEKAVKQSGQIAKLNATIKKALGEGD